MKKLKLQAFKIKSTTTAKAKLSFKILKKIYLSLPLSITVNSKGISEKRNQNMESFNKREL